MEDNAKIYFLLVMPILFKENSSFTFCKESATKIRYVKECPKDTKSWDIAAKNMNCEAIKQNCSSSQQHQFQYHCVINEFENALLEVCALNRTIFEHCPEYNTQGNVIQEHYDAKCAKLNPPCSTFYNSAESYKYPACYKLVKELKINSTYPPLQSSSIRACGCMVLPFAWIFSTTMI